MEMFSLLKKYWMLCEPKSVGASRHPDEGVFHFGSHIFAISQSSQSNLDYIDEMLRFISNTQLFCYTLDTSYNHGCHITNEFCLEPNDYKVLLVIAGLAPGSLLPSSPKMGLHHMVDWWKMFLEGHHCTHPIAQAHSK